MTLNEVDWRHGLKSGPLGRVYGLLRRTKRKLRGEPLAGYVPLTFPPLQVSHLLKLAPSLQDHSRFYYSLGLAYLTRGQPGDALKAGACLRTAEAFGFESPERTLLHLARAELRSSVLAKWMELLAEIDPRDLTPHEQSLVIQMRERDTRSGDEAFPHRTWKPEREVLDGERVTSLLVVGDGAAATAFWCPDARYVSATPEVTGLKPESIAEMGSAFYLCVGSPSAVANARSLGIRCAHWRAVEDGVEMA